MTEWCDTAAALVEAVKAGKKNVGARSVDLSEDDVGKLAAALKGSAVQRLSVVSGGVNIKKAPTLCDGIKEATSLVYLNLNGNSLGNEGAKLLAAALAELKANPLDVFLTGNNITDEGASALLECVKSNDRIQMLDLDGNRVDKKILKAIHDAAENNL